MTATATLIRGRVYCYRDVMYEKEKPITVTDELAAELEALTDDVMDRDGEFVQKARFKIVHKAATKADGHAAKVDGVRKLGGGKLQTSAKPAGRIKPRVRSA